MARAPDEPLDPRTEGANDQLETLARPRVEPASNEVATFVLTVIEGPDVGVTFSLDGSQPRVLIGTGPACALRLRVCGTVSASSSDFIWTPWAE